MMKTAKKYLAPSLTVEEIRMEQGVAQSLVFGDPGTAGGNITVDDTDLGW